MHECAGLLMIGLLSTLSDALEVHDCAGITRSGLLHFDPYKVHECVGMRVMSLLYSFLCINTRCMTVLA